jgi:hypothetical protein
MRVSGEKLTEIGVAVATERARHTARALVRNALKYLLDSEKEKRLQTLECKFCYYLEAARFGLQAITSKECDICGENVAYASTATGRVCEVCAAKYNVCTHCGGDLSMDDLRANPIPEGDDD